jgi:hypothetical protein
LSGSERGVPEEEDEDWRNAWSTVVMGNERFDVEAFPFLCGVDAAICLHR